jgi:hypothetical protein
MQPGERRGADGLQIPLLVGEVRRCGDHGGEEGAALAVDVVFHPWITARCDEDNTFKAQAIDLALGWVEQETGYKFEKNKWKTIKSKYKGGSGEQGDQPMPFPVDRALEQDGPMGERTKPADAAASPQAAPTAPVAGLSTLSPESLLRAAKAPVAHGAPLDIKMPATPRLGSAQRSSSAAEPRVLISEVAAPKPKAAGPSVAKGFLHPKAGKAAPRLYDDRGSSGDGAKEVVDCLCAPNELVLLWSSPRLPTLPCASSLCPSLFVCFFAQGSYSRLLSKCNVVDMSTMTPEQQKFAMEKHAAPAPAEAAPAAPVPAAAPKAPALQPSSRGDGTAGLDGLRTGFLSNNGGSLYGAAGSSEGAPTPARASQTDALFDALIAGACKNT